MSATPEYRTLTILTDELRLAVQYNLVALSDRLVEEFLISPEKASQLTNPMLPEADRAAYLVYIIRNKVFQNPHCYHTFVQVLESEDYIHYDILRRLDMVYHQTLLYSSQWGPSSRIQRRYLKRELADLKKKQSQYITISNHRTVAHCRFVLMLILASIIAVLCGMILMRFEIVNTTNHIIVPWPVPDIKFIHFETKTLENYNKINQTINLKQFGCKLHFLPNTSLEPVSFTIGIAAGSLPDIIPPANTTLVSALYYIKTSSELLQPVIIEIQHCVTGTNGRQMFAKAPVESDHSSPFVFTKLSGGKLHRKYWGTIMLSNFSIVAVFDEDENSSINYLAHISRLRHSSEPSVYQVALTASLNLNAYKEVVKNGHKDWVPVLFNPLPFVFTNGSTALTLCIGKEGIQSGNWEIKPTVMPPEIKRNAIHSFGMASYELKVSWISDEEEVLLEYFMGVQGVNWEAFMIYINPHEKAATISDGHHSHIQGEFRCTEIEDFQELYQQVSEIGDWYGLCLNLGVSDAKMNELKHSNERVEEKKRECLLAYFNTGEAYWEEVVGAIIKHPVSNKRIAKIIIGQQKLRSELLYEPIKC